MKMLNYVILFSYINADIMENKAKKVQEKATTFFRNSLQYYGKEIALDSNQFFSIEQIVNDENLQNGIYDYQVQ